MSGKHPRPPELVKGTLMKYALLVYTDDASDPADRPMEPAIATALEQPDVTGWVRLRSAGSATTLSVERGRTLLTDGPFVASKEFLGGIILVDAADLDAALVVAGELQATRADEGGAIEVRPILQERLAGA